MLGARTGWWGGGDRGGDDTGWRLEGGALVGFLMFVGGGGEVLGKGNKGS